MMLILKCEKSFVQRVREGQLAVAQLAERSLPLSEVRGSIFIASYSVN